MEAVKQGWSWPAFFFSFIWVFVRGMYVIGIIKLALYFILGFLFLLLLMLIGITPTTINIIWKYVFYIVIILFGIFGNILREKNLLSRGYEPKGTVVAWDQTSAIARYCSEVRDIIDQGFHRLDKNLRESRTTKPSESKNLRESHITNPSYFNNLMEYHATNPVEFAHAYISGLVELIEYVTASIVAFSGKRRLVSKTNMGETLFESHFDMEVAGFEPLE